MERGDAVVFHRLHLFKICNGFFLIIVLDVRALFASFLVDVEGWGSRAVLCDPFVS
jgi:hypothetical protein